MVVICIVIVVLLFLLAIGVKVWSYDDGIFVSARNMDKRRISEDVWICRKVNSCTRVVTNDISGGPFYHVVADDSRHIGIGLAAWLNNGKRPYWANVLVLVTPELCATSMYHGSIKISARGPMTCCIHPDGSFDWKDDDGDDAKMKRRDLISRLVNDK